jgi:hypothetical protein
VSEAKHSCTASLEFNPRISIGAHTLKKMKRTSLVVLTIALVVVSTFGLLWVQPAGSTSVSTVVPTATPVEVVNGISQEAAQQILALDAEKNSRTPTQRKIDSRLLYRLKQARSQSIAPGVEQLETGLTVDAKGFIEVEIRAEVNERLMSFLKKRGAKIESTVSEWRSIAASVPLLSIEELASQSGVYFVQPKQDYMTNEVNTKSQPTTSNDDYRFNPFMSEEPAVQVREARFNNVRSQLTTAIDDLVTSGTAVAEGDITHRASLARTLMGVDGTGIKIGVLSNGVTSLAARQASGDLPATVTVLAGQAGTGDEGTAMLELIYDMAPGAQLFFATANPTSAQFAQNIKDLRTAGCDIIVDDVSYFVESPFQNGQAPSVIAPSNGGVVTQAVNDVTIGSQAGAMYFSSAANSGNKNDGTAGAWEGDFADGGVSAAPLPVGVGNVHNFGGANFDTLTVGNRTLLKWSDPLGASGNDYDLYVLNSTGTTVTASSTNIQDGNDDPVEDVGTRSTGERLVILKKTGAADRFLHLNTNRGVLSISTPGVIYGHNGGLNTFSVAATPAGPARNNLSIGPYPNAHSSIDTVETFSSDGPRRIFYNADSTSITPGNVSSTGGQLLQKPDITAADGETTTTPTFIPFFGTSAAAPTASALMALLKQASPAATRTQLYNAMTSSAIDIEAAGVDRDSGAGIFMPLRAAAALGVSGPAFLDRGPFTVIPPSGGNARLDPGEVGNLFIRLDNLGLSNATNITATLSTSTPLVTVAASPTRTYADLAAAVGTATSTTAFRFALDPSFPCGAPIDFTLTVNYNGGSVQVFNFTITPGAIVTINETLDTTAPSSTTSYTASTGIQVNRLNRNGITSNCSSAKATPALQEALPGTNKRYDAFTFTASASGCTTVTLSATFNNAANNIFMAVYGNGGYNPAAIQTNYLADWGVTSAGLVTVGFNATAGQQYTVVVHEITTNAGLNQAYTLNVTGPIANACSLSPTAAPVTLAGRVSTPNGAAIRNAIVTATDADGIIHTARSNTFGYYRIDGLDASTTYFVTASAKGYSFDTKLVSLTGDLMDYNLVAK